MKQNELAPIALFVYNRLEQCIHTIRKLQNNYLANKTALYVFSDGARTKIDESKISQIRCFLKTIEGFKEISIIESPVNKGLANSIISGVSEIMNRYGKVIVLEDDLITSPNFLNFMNQALDYYKDNEKIHSISGYSMDLSSLKTNPLDYYVGLRATSWGWATWDKVWQEVDWEVNTYPEFKASIKSQFKLFQIGSDMPRMLRHQMNGKIDSWAIRWCYHQFLNKSYTIFPTISKVQNIGFGGQATHTIKGSRFKTTLDKGEQTNFDFNQNCIPDSQIIKEFRRKYSISARAKERFL
ncbi:sugar transferase [uncultured Draconibacterium sp.]|uniref:sugar transferase n=1 Tax=uncultured Draconibacterium sp. TaxID=1573823 RepID=UPI00321756FE